MYQIFQFIIILRILIFFLGRIMGTRWGGRWRGLLMKSETIDKEDHKIKVHTILNSTKNKRKI